MAKFSIKQITTRAKQIYKKGGTWQSAIKKAGAEYRGKKRSGSKVSRKKKVSGVKRKTTTRKKRVGAIRTNRDGVDRKRVNVTIGSVQHHKSALKSGIKSRIETKAGRRELAIKKNERKKLTREIAKLKKDYRALC